MLTKADDYPIHQRPEPIATAGTDRNFYDRYFFNGYSRDGEVFFAAALGVYPHLNVMDASFSTIVDGVQHNLRASRLMSMERMDTAVGPISIEVVEPLKTLRLRVGDNPHGIRADVTFHARAQAVEEPRFTYRIGPRTLLDYTRLTQNGVYEGFIEVAGKRIELARDKIVGTRDRSWGVRPIGLPDQQPALPLRLPQFYWLWAPLNFDDRFLLYHKNADEHGRSWNEASAIGALGEAAPRHMARAASGIRYKQGTRHAQSATLDVTDADGAPWQVELTPRFQFYMSGIGYMHPEWGHGMYRGDDALGYDTYDLGVLNENEPRFQHIQAFVTAKLTGPGGVTRDGAGVLEQLVIGQYAPDKLTGIFDPRAMPAMKDALERYLADKLGQPGLSVHDIARIPGGASRETYRFRARHGDVERKLILRRDPPASLIETERSTEYRAYAAFHKLGLPVPEPIALELDGAVLERPFFIMEEIENCQVGSILAPDPYGAHRDRIGKQFWGILGTIAGADPHTLGLADFDGATSPDQCWRHEVARWEKVIDADEAEPQPIARGALAWLKRNPPPPARKIAVVHGDYRSGNFLFDGNGDIKAILDWEMAHLGDPLEDLAWALDPLWAHHDPSHPAGTLARDDAIRVWEEASGLKADSDALLWWEIFASLKGCAIWISAAHEYATRRNDDPVNAFSGWYCLAYHNQVLANRLEALA